MIKKKKIPQTHKKKKEKKNSQQAKGLLFTAKNKTKQNKNLLRANVSRYRPEGLQKRKTKILKKIHKVALGKLLT